MLAHVRRKSICTEWRCSSYAAVRCSDFHHVLRSHLLHEMEAWHALSNVFLGATQALPQGGGYGPFRPSYVNSLGATSTFVPGEIVVGVGFFTGSTMLLLLFPFIIFWFSPGPEKCLPRCWWTPADIGGCWVIDPKFVGGNGFEGDDGVRCKKRMQFNNNGTTYLTGIFPAERGIEPATLYVANPGEPPTC